jgi:sugar O-acyltransferase (sialic acid O-acetyltransferase NeuD family)
MKDKLIIIGAGGHGKVVADIAIKSNKWQGILFLDDDEAVKSVLGLEVIGKSMDASIYRDEADFFVAIGNNLIREIIQKNLLDGGISVVSLIHPNAVIGTDARIGVGTVVMAGVIINSSSMIGDGCIINTNSSIEHDCVIGDYVHISPGSNLAGAVRVGQGSWLGIGSTVSNNVQIYSGCIIGAGAVVIDDINESGTYVGVPVRRLSG